MRRSGLVAKTLALVLAVMLLLPNMVWAEDNTDAAAQETVTEESAAPEAEIAEEGAEEESDEVPLEHGELPQTALSEGQTAETMAEGGSGSEAPAAVPEAEPEPPLVVKDTDGKQLTVKVTLTDYEMPSDGADVRAAVWSAKGDQDDLRWYVMEKDTDGKYSYTFKIADHKTEGEYAIHTYLRKKNNEMVFLYAEKFFADKVTADAVEIVNKDDAAGTCDIVVRNVSNPSGIKSVSVRVWSKSDKSDLATYTATKSGSDWVAAFDIAKHKYNTGTYTIEADAEANNGISMKAATGSVEFDSSSITCDISAALEVGQVRLSMSRVRVPDTEAAYFAVWSKLNDQDDLVWHEVTLTDGAGEKLLPLADCKDIGDYNVHAYVRQTDGTMVFLGKTIFNLRKFGANSVRCTPNNNEGTFQVLIKGVKPVENVKSVVVEVWSDQDGKDDVRSYTAKKQENGDYLVTSGIDKHKYNEGLYNVYVYCKSYSGQKTLVGKRTFELNLPGTTVSAEAVKENIKYKVKAEGVVIPGDLKEVQCAVWSVENGQDDLVWYTMAKSAAAAYAAEVDVSRHQSQGLYNAHVYALMADGTKAFLGKTTFEVVFKVTGTVTGENPDTNDAGFDAVFRVTEATPDITKVQIPVWCASDQSDIVWYDAEKVDDTTYKVKVRVVNHKGNLGTYKIHVYATLESGIRLFAGSANYEFNPPSVLLVFNDQQYGYRRIVLKNAPAGLKSVSFPAWSKKNGQDDIVWYTGKKNSSTEWQCVIDSAKHKDGGTFLVHCYGDGDTLLGGITFNFPASEFGKNGWVYEGGYKLYYDHNKLVTDVEYLIGKQSSYVLRVNRTTCTVTVYAYDSAKGGYIIPVKVFLCSVGTAKDPSPVGTFHTSAKYRWKAMNGPSFAQYATRIVDHVLFHSIPCPDYGQPWDQYQVPAYKYNLLGQPASQGCIRLQCASAKWIYDNCPIGTTVVIYDSPNPGPLGKPVLVPIPESQNWDPTDPSVNR